MFHNDLSLTDFSQDSSGVPWWQQLIYTGSDIAKSYIAGRYGQPGYANQALGYQPMPPREESVWEKYLPILLIVVVLIVALSMMKKK